MKYQLILCAAALAGLAGPAAALTESERLQAVTKYLDRGRHELSRARQADSRASKLILLQDAVYSLHRARGEASRAKSGDACCDLQCAVDKTLVTALDDQAEIYYVRGSQPKALKRVTEALDVLPEDARSLALYNRITGSEANGTYAIGRIPGDSRGARPSDFGAAPVTPSERTKTGR